MLSMPSKSKPAPAAAPAAPAPGSVPSSSGEEGDEAFEPMEGEEGPDLAAVPLEVLEAEVAKRKAAEAGAKKPPMAGASEEA